MSYASFLSFTHSLSLSIIYRQWLYLYLFSLCAWVESMKRGLSIFLSSMQAHKNRNIEKNWVCSLNVLLFFFFRHHFSYAYFFITTVTNSLLCKIYIYIIVNQYKETMMMVSIKLNEELLTFYLKKKLDRLT